MMKKNYDRRYFLGMAGGSAMGLALGMTASRVEASESEIRNLLSGFTWFKQSGFRIEADKKIIYLDPYQISTTPQDGDLVLVTHAHSDHCDPTSARRVIKADGKIVTEPESAAKLKGIGSGITQMKPGDEMNMDGIKINAVPAYNGNHPKSKNYLGFVVTLGDGRRIYHAGDTDQIPEMADIRTDIALLPIGGTYTMNADQAAEAIKVIRPKVAVPMHYGAVVGSARDADKFKQDLSGLIEVYIFKNGESISPATGVIHIWKQH